MNGIVVASDAISMIAFFSAAGMALFTRRGHRLVTRPVRWVFAAAMCLYGFVGFSNLLEHAGITPMLDVYEDFAEILFVPALAFTGSTMLLNQQVVAQADAATLMRQQNDLLLNIVDTVPGGILVVDPTGAITFANEGADRLLGMISDSGGSVRLTPSWTLRDPGNGAETTLGEIASGGGFQRRPLFAQWPDGTTTELVFSATPMSTHDGDLGGSIVAFEAASKRG